MVERRHPNAFVNMATMPMCSPSQWKMMRISLVVEAQVLHTEKTFDVVCEQIVEPPLTTAEVIPKALVGRPPPRRRLSAKGSIQCQRGADLTLSEGWACCSHMACEQNIFQTSKIPG